MAQPGPGPVSKRALRAYRNAKRLSNPDGWPGGWQSGIEAMSAVARSPGAARRVRPRPKPRRVLSLRKRGCKALEWPGRKKRIRPGSMCGLCGPFRKATPAGLRQRGGQ